MLNNKDLRCLPRAEINNSLTGEVGKQARDRGSASGEGKLVGVGGCGGGAAVESARGTARLAWRGGEGGVTVGIGVRQRAGLWLENSRKGPVFVVRPQVLIAFPAQ